MPSVSFGIIQTGVKAGAEIRSGDTVMLKIIKQQKNYLKKESMMVLLLIYSFRMILRILMIQKKEQK